MSMEIEVSETVYVTVDSGGVVRIKTGYSIVSVVAVRPDELPALIAALEKIRDQQAGGAK